MPQHIYRTIITPSSSGTNVFSSKAAINECGLSVSATVTGYVSDQSLAANPYVEEGIDEQSIPILLGLSCSSAREAIELLAKIIEDVGSAEDNILMVSDQNEA